ncbi:MAG: methyltransferase domain-containing protein [Lewinellaceae bacterium]|nr:methyltransferase domain-containing protein [Lewinellaceae bacterium]
MNEYSIHGGKRGNDRLAILSQTVGATTGEFLDRYTSSFFGDCLDLGCGGGTVTLQIADRVQHTGTVTGLDIDPVNVALARKTAHDRQMENVQFERFNAYDLADVDRYHVVYSRFLLSHLNKPSQVLANVYKGLVPGGRLLLEDTDFSGHFCFPACPAFHAYVHLYQKLLYTRGADANIGQRLYQLLQQAGFQEISVQVVQPVHTGGKGKLMAEITMEGISNALLQEGLTNRDVIQQIVQELKAFRADKNTVMSLPRIFQVSAVKPKQ